MNGIGSLQSSFQMSLRCPSCGGRNGVCGCGGMWGGSVRSRGSGTGNAASEQGEICPECGQTRTACVCAEGYSSATGNRDNSGNAKAGDSRSKGSPENPQGLTTEEKEQVEELQARDREVRAHENAHIAAGGAHISGGARYSLQMGPDGRMYAVGGEVSIDTSPVPNDPDATLEKARQVRAAAMAPAEPSGKDIQVAASASSMEAEARAEKKKEEESASGNSLSGRALPGADSVSEPDARYALMSLSAGETGRSGYARNAADAYLRSVASPDEDKAVWLQSVV